MENSQVNTIEKLEHKIEQSDKTIRNIMSILNELSCFGTESKKELRNTVDKIIKEVNSHYDKVELNKVINRETVR